MSSVVVDDVAILVDLEHGLGFAVDDHVHGLRECRRKGYLDVPVTLLYQVETAAVARVRRYVEPEKRVAVAEIVARQLVAFVLRVFAGGREKVHVAANVLARLEVRLKRFRRHLTSVDVDG